MPIPRVAIVGRPNVGKSSLLNMIARDKVSIVDPTAGTTRDRVSIIADLAPPDHTMDSPDRITVEVTDTGGFGVYVEDGRRFDDVGKDLTSLTDDIEFQISQAVAGADLVLFVIDAQDGITSADQRVAKLLRERVLGHRGTGKDAHAQRASKVHIRIVANKCDGPRWEAHAYEAAALGFGEPLPVSAKNNYFRRDFLDELYRELASIPGVHIGSLPDPPGLKIAIIGKRNAGKSTLVNQIAGEQRVIVSEIAGTTRDAVDVHVKLDGREFTVIDTAGLRKKKSFADRIEWWAYDRAQRSVERADIVWLLVDSTEPLSQVDHQLMKLVQNSFKPCVIVVNKWDMAEGRPAAGSKHWRKGQGVTAEMYQDYLREETKGLDYAPLAFMSAKSGRGVRDCVDLAFELFDQSSRRAPTGRLNRLLKHILSTRGPSSKLGTFAKTYFISQVAVNPPTIVLVVNKPQLFTVNYQKFLLNRLREALEFPEVPIKLIIKERKRARIEDLLSGEHQRLKEAGAAVVDADVEREVEQIEALEQSPDAAFKEVEFAEFDPDAESDDAATYFEDGDVDDDDDGDQEVDAEELDAEELGSDESDAEDSEDDQGEEDDGKGPVASSQPDSTPASRAKSPTATSRPAQPKPAGKPARRTPSRPSQPKAGKPGGKAPKSPKPTSRSRPPQRSSSTRPTSTRSTSTRSTGNRSPSKGKRSR